MRLKYYMRGLGIGIAVTAVVLNFSVKQNTKELSDEQIKARAVELGMVEKSLLSDVLEDTQTPETTEEQALSEEAVTEPSTEVQSTEEAGSEVSTEAQSTEEAEREAGTEANTEAKASEESNTEAPLDEKSQTISDKNKETEKQQETEQKLSTEEKQEVINIVVNSGESSVAISKKLQIAGLVTSAGEFDQFLCKNGYDKKICTGNHTINKGASNEEIAKAITTK